MQKSQTEIVQTLFSWVDQKKKQKKKKIVLSQFHVTIWDADKKKEKKKVSLLSSFPLAESFVPK